MAMNKKVKAAFDEALMAARLLGALRSTTAVKEDVPPPEIFAGPLSTGFVGRAYGRLEFSVEVACSSSVHHAVGRTDKTNSQGAISLYSTRLLALRGARYRMERLAAQALERIDREIEAELSAIA